MTPSPSHSLLIAQQAFDRFTQGLASGEWQAFLEMLSEDFTFWFPTGEYHGLNVGKARAAAFFRYVSAAFSEGLSVEVDRITHNNATVVFELRTEGRLRGELYKNRVAVSFDVCGDQICAYREYFGSDGRSN